MTSKLTENGLCSFLGWFDKNICEKCSKFKSAKCLPDFSREKENTNNVAYKPRCFEIFMELQKDE